MRDLLDYYERELGFLRNMGKEFAQKYPRVASRLLLEADNPDPHVERMIESFALLAGRIHLKLDDEFPEITESLLNILYPHYLAPTPSMSIVQFLLDPDQGKLTSGYNIERGTLLYSKPINTTQCRFRTGYPVTLWPIEVVSASLAPLSPANNRGQWPEARIKISLRCINETRLADLKVVLGDRQRTIDSLRFYLNGDPPLVYPLYELLFNHVTRAELKPVASSRKKDGEKAGDEQRKPSPVEVKLKAVGFEDDENLLPYAVRSFPGYRLLSEYFAFPEKFLFFDVVGLTEAARAGFGEQFDLIINLRDVTPPQAELDADAFQLGCAPIINLFSMTADPITLTQRKHEYRIEPDIYRPLATEVYTVDRVFTTDPHQQQTREFQPFYSFRHAEEEEEEEPCYWYASRRPSDRKDIPGTEVWLSLIDRGFNPHVPAVETVTLYVTCTNRDLPRLLNPNIPKRDQQGKIILNKYESDFQIEGSAPLAFVRCLKNPTETLRPPLGRGAQWRIISHLSLNHLSLVGNEKNNDSPDALREILLLYDFTGSLAMRRQINGILQVSSRRKVERIRQPNADLRIGANYVRGVETTVKLDEEQYVGGGLLLFTAVLERFLGLYASVNSFNQLVVSTKQREGIVKRWPPRMGEHILL